ncbi:hypothetical protein [Nocardiopsis sp. CC223A]|uniref:hypothetical protein n=1 Tax=Nocardiopsis sp. CC223A TaxID=3044051 RepID=UPI00278C4638|nr:hypothetical protein [Nocardiopsis sp. CC223A]
MATHTGPRADTTAVPHPGREHDLDPRAELSEFLHTRRARLKPEEEALRLLASWGADAVAPRGLAFEAVGVCSSVLDSALERR